MVPKGHVAGGIIAVPVLRLAARSSMKIEDDIDLVFSTLSDKSS